MKNGQCNLSAGCPYPTLFILHYTFSGSGRRVSKWSATPATTYSLEDYWLLLPAIPLERKTGLEPATYSLEGYRSTN